MTYALRRALETLTRALAELGDPAAPGLAARLRDGTAATWLQSHGGKLARVKVHAALEALERFRPHLPAPFAWALVTAQRSLAEASSLLAQVPARPALRLLQGGKSDPMRAA